MRFAPRIVPFTVTTSATTELIDVADSVICWGILASHDTAATSHALIFSNAAGTTLFTISLGGGVTALSSSMDIPFLVDKGLNVTNANADTINITLFLSNVGA